MGTSTLHSLHSDTQKARLWLRLDERPLELHLGPLLPRNISRASVLQGCGPCSTPPWLSARLSGGWRRRQGAARCLGSLGSVSQDEHSASAQHPVSSSHPGHPTPGWELRVLGRWSAAATSACPLSLGRETVAIPEGQSQGQPPSAVVGSPGYPKAPDVPFRPALTDVPPSHATPTWTEEEGWCARTKVGGLLSAL